LKDTDYLSYIGQDAKSDEELNERKANLAELKRELAEYAGYTLTDYLNRSALLSEGDKVQRDDDALTLMTLHAAKGLEFPVVFIVGVEEGLMPHSMSQNNPQELAEERRLFYVGITRAKDRLYLTYARERVQNSNSYGTASPFLRSIPSELMSTNTSLGRRSNTPPPSEKRAWQWQAGKGAYTPAPASTPAAPARKIKPARFQAGEVVRHRKFGQGMVMKSIPQEDFEEVEVRFESGEIKRLDANYLEKP
jgi:DNA helicase-2/ATP-dependent DNA helicase PcrA